MHIRELKGQDIELYNEIASSYGTVFDSSKLLSVYGENVKIYGFCDDKDELIGGFHLFHYRRFGLSIYRNAPFSPYVGPFIKISSTSRTKLYTTWKKALTSMADFLEELPYSIISIALHKSVNDTQPFIWKNFKVSPRYTYIIDLNETMDDIWSKLSTSHRNHISKAKKDGLEARLIEDREVIRNMVLKTFSRQSKRLDVFYLDKLLSFYGPENSYIYATYNHDEYISASLFVYDGRTSYCLLAGYDHEKKHGGAGTLDRWEGIKHAKAMNLKYFDFEGSMHPAIEKFFRNFGGELSPYYSVNKAKLPIEIALKFYKRELF